MNLDQFLQAYEGKTVGYPDGQYLGECLSLAKHYIKDCFGIEPPPSGCNAARCYWSKFPNPLGTVFKKVPNTPDLIPERGWIAVWDENAGGGYGHIAIVLDATLSKFTSLDQNWNGKQAHRVSHYYKNVSGFLAPLSISQGNMSEKIYTEEEMSKVRIQRDENWNLYQEQISENKLTKERLSGELQKEKDSHQKDLDSIAKVLVVSPEIEKIVPAIETCITFEDKARDLEKKLEQERTQYASDLKALSTQIEKLKKGLSDAEEEIRRLKEEKPEPVITQPNPPTLIGILIYYIKGLFK